MQRFYIEKVIRSGTRNAVVRLDNGSMLKVPVEQAEAGTWLEFQGKEDNWLNSIKAELFSKVSPNDKPPVMLESFLY